MVINQHCMHIIFMKSGRGYPQISLHTYMCNSVCNIIISKILQVGYLLKDSLQQKALELLR